MAFRQRIAAKEKGDTTQQRPRELKNEFIQMTNHLGRMGTIPFPVKAAQRQNLIYQAIDLSGSTVLVTALLF